MLLLLSLFWELPMCGPDYSDSRQEKSIRSFGLPVFGDFVMMESVPIRGSVASRYVLAPISERDPTLPRIGTDSLATRLIETKDPSPKANNEIHCRSFCPVLF